MAENDPGFVEPVNLFKASFEEMFANPSSSNSQAAFSGARASSQSEETPAAAEAEVLALSPENSYPPPEAAPVSEPVDEAVVQAAPAESVSEPVDEAVVEAAEPVSEPVDEAVVEAAPGEPVDEAVVEAAPAAEANDTLPEAAPEESRRSTGPRGPNVHTSPTTLAELAPPGCSITLNSNLALGFILSLVLLN